jgi:hypothetical protein
VPCSEPPVKGFLNFFPAQKKSMEMEIPIGRPAKAANVMTQVKQACALLMKIPHCELTY